MPYPIKVSLSQGGIASYQLGRNEEWTLLAVTFGLVAEVGAGGDNLAWLDMRDPSGALIMLQPLAPGDGENMFYSLAVDASEFNYPNVNNAFVPQDDEAFGNNYVSQRLSPQTLYSGCTVNAYKSKGDESPPTDPITNVSTLYSIPDLHLWVEDTVESQFRQLPPPQPVGPYMLVPGPNV